MHNLTIFLVKMLWSPQIKTNIAIWRKKTHLEFNIFSRENPLVTYWNQTIVI